MTEFFKKEPEATVICVLLLLLCCMMTVGVVSHTIIKVWGCG